MTAAYATTGIRVRQEELLSLVESMFRAAGMDSDDALLLADSLVTADLGGTHSHGVLRVPEYAKKMTVDGVNPGGTLASSPTADL